ncbi:MAG: aromatic ring-hydroxylating dioxygenase subunit alpha [Enhydrobacter sp.]|nr:aromatic ring-hydroxylating dioxygenase subunit alpha [Enhydrobacter sp.]
MADNAGAQGGGFVGYHKAVERSEDAEARRVARGTAGGEYMRRFWHPIALSGQVRTLPKRVRILGEDLVVFRDLGGRLGCLHLHCSHRGTSLEFGVLTERGISCCYHGWRYDIDGTILDTPGEPAGSTIKVRVCHGAYPVREHGGLIFGYFGAPEAMPPFFLTDATVVPGNELHPYLLTFDCNWLQAHENSMDPIHSVFLHTRVSNVQFSQSFGALPVVRYRQTELGVISTAVRRIGENVWVRVNDDLTPNVAQFGPPWEDGSQEKLFVPPAITRWITPIDDTHCMTIGWRHCNPIVDPQRRIRTAEIGLETVDFFGQTPHRPYEDRQREPGDWDAQVSQRPMSIHALENLGTTDMGIAMLRKNIQQGVLAVKEGTGLKPLPLRDGVLSTYAHDTVLRLPQKTNDDTAVLAEVGDTVTGITLDSWSAPHGERRQYCIARLRESGLC